MKFPNPEDLEDRAAHESRIKMARVKAKAVGSYGSKDTKHFPDL